MKIIENLQQNTPEWHSFRKNKIGASMAAAIMGVSPYQTKLELYNELKGISSPTQENDAMYRGKRLEAEAREKFKLTFGMEFCEPIVVESEEIPWMIASLDGWDEKTRMLLEIKCPGKKDHSMALRGEIPPHYYPQLQHQMAVTGTTSCYYFSYDGQSGTCVMCHRNEDYISSLIVAEREFFFSLTLGNPPTASERDELVIDDPIVLSEAYRYKFLLEEMERMEKEKERLKKIIIDRCSHPKNRIGDVKVNKVSRKGNIDYEAIPELESVNKEIYRKPGIEYWEISL